MYIIKFRWIDHLQAGIIFELNTPVRYLNLCEKIGFLGVSRNFSLIFPKIHRFLQIKNQIILPLTFEDNIGVSTNEETLAPIAIVEHANVAAFRSLVCERKRGVIAHVRQTSESENGVVAIEFYDGSVFINKLSTPFDDDFPAVLHAQNTAVESEFSTVFDDEFRAGSDFNITIIHCYPCIFANDDFCGF